MHGKCDQISWVVSLKAKIFVSRAIGLKNQENIKIILSSVNQNSYLENSGLAKNQI